MQPLEISGGPSGTRTPNQLIKSLLTGGFAPTAIRRNILQRFIKFQHSIALTNADYLSQWSKNGARNRPALRGVLARTYEKKYLKKFV